LRQFHWLKRNRIFRSIVRVVAGPAQLDRLAWQGIPDRHGFTPPSSEPAYRSPARPAPELSSGDENVHIACACYQAYVDRDRAAIEALIADDFHFTSPLDNRIDRKSYFDRCWPTSRTMRGFEFVHLASEGDCVFITYEAETAEGKRFRNTEVMRIRDGRIYEVQVFFGWTVPHEARDGRSIDAPG
jgi:ketosteroid isomerase-like protein